MYKSNGESYFLARHLLFLRGNYSEINRLIFEKIFIFITCGKPLHYC
jgi:hypothetical protein